MNESADAHLEGDPAIEQIEQKTLGTTTYEKVEEVHQFANANPWLHPLLLGVGLVFLVVIGLLAWRFILKDKGVRSLKK